MTPTPDNLKALVADWRKRASTNESGDFAAGRIIAYECAADELQAALTASCDARVGGEVAWAADLAALKEVMAEASAVPLQWQASTDFTPEQAKEWLSAAVSENVRHGDFTGELHSIVEFESGLTVAFTGCGPKSAANAKFLIWCAHFVMKHMDALATPAQPKASTYDDFVRLAKDPNRPKASEGKAGGEDARDAARYRWLRDSQDCALHIEHNDHHTVYESAEAKIRWQENDPKADYFGDVPEDEKRRMIESDSIWTMHIYPNTPVGFNVYHAATLDAAIDAAMTATLTAPGADDVR